MPSWVRTRWSEREDAAVGDMSSPGLAAGYARDRAVTTEATLARAAEAEQGATASADDRPDAHCAQRPSTWHTRQTRGLTSDFGVWTANKSAAAPDGKPGAAAKNATRIADRPSSRRRPPRSAVNPPARRAAGPGRDPTRAPGRARSP